MSPAKGKSASESPNSSYAKASARVTPHFRKPTPQSRASGCVYPADRSTPGILGHPVAGSQGDQRAREVLLPSLTKAAPGQRNVLCGLLLRDGGGLGIFLGKSA